MSMYEIASALVQDLLHAFLQMKPSTTDLALGKVNFEKRYIIMQDTTQGIATKAHELSCYCLGFNEWIGLVETCTMEPKKS